jgi:hypothetical protein
MAALGMRSELKARDDLGCCRHRPQSDLFCSRLVLAFAQLAEHGGGIGTLHV